MEKVSSLSPSKLLHDEEFYYDFPYKLSEVAKHFKAVLKESKFQPEDKKRIRRAWAQACIFHRGQTRSEAPGLPYIIHPLEVALEVLRLGGSPDQVIAALFHDVREDVGQMREMKNGEVVEVFKSRSVELLTRLLSKYRLEIYGVLVKSESRFVKFLKKRFTEFFSNFADVKELTNEEYFEKLSQDWAAIWIKAIDRRVNLMSCGRMLDHALDAPRGQANAIFGFVENQIKTTHHFVIPAVESKYPTLAKNLKLLTLNLGVRLRVAKLKAIEVSNAQLSARPASTPHDV